MTSPSESEYDKIASSRNNDVYGALMKGTGVWRRGGVERLLFSASVAPRKTARYQALFS
jgi:hypothetical protein